MSSYVLVEGVDRLMGWLFEWQRFTKEVASGKLNHNFAHIMLNHCIEEAPERSGKLKASHAIKIITPAFIGIINTAEYAIFVHDGFVHYKSGNLVKGNPWMIRGIMKSMNDMGKLTYESVLMRKVPELATGKKAAKGLKAGSARTKVNIVVQVGK